jgi:hypothetical protein
VKSLRPVTFALVVFHLSVIVAAAADRPQQAFVRDWEGKHVVVARTLFSLVYNERGLLGNTTSGKRDGLVVVTPFEGTYMQFDGRQGRDDVVERDPQAVVNGVATAYAPDSLDVRQYRKVEPVMMARYDAGVELVVSSVRIARDSVRLVLALPTDPQGDAPVTSLTVRWPMPLSKSLSEREPIENLIRGFLVAGAAATTR